MHLLYSYIIILAIFHNLLKNKTDLCQGIPQKPLWYNEFTFGRSSPYQKLSLIFYIL